MAEVYGIGMQSYMQQWVIIPYCIEQLQGGYSHFKVKEWQLLMCNTAGIPSPHRHISNFV
jgi:hypothetical protein